MLEQISGIEPESRASLCCERSESILEEEMVKIIVCEHGKKAVERAGKVLRQDELQVGQMYGGYDYTPQQAFRVAHDWRDSHNYPQWRLRIEMGNMARSVDSGVTCASRLKRMSSIRAKLRKNVSLYQMQDIAGCRAILGGVSDVNALAIKYQDGASKHRMISENDYLAEPKEDGYRSRHIIMKFVGEPERDSFTRNTIELQLRSRLQHSWATAVEVIDLITGQNLKGGEGDADWKRFFALISSQFAEFEGCPPVPGTPSDLELGRVEIRELEKKLDAVRSLEKFKNAVKHIEETYYFGTHSKLFLLQYDLDTNSVSVTTYGELSFDRSIYGQQEQEFPNKNTVLVNVDDAESLIAAYPNYFMDVGDFLQRLKVITMGANVSPLSYSMSWLKSAFSPKS